MPSMVLRTVKLLGGLWDGMPVPVERSANWMWIDAVGDEIRGYQAFRPGRLLYVKATLAGDGVYLYAHDLYTMCVCGVTHAKHDPEGIKQTHCTLCGSELHG